MPIALAQTSFAGGVLGPSLYGRFDVAKYDVALRVGSNIFVHVYGGASNRSGTEFLAEVCDSTDAGRLIGFSFNTEQTYMLEFGDGVMRVFRDGAPVLDPTALTITGATQADPVVITSTAHGLSNGDRVYVDAVGGMTEINGKYFTASAVTANTFALQDMWGVDVDGTGFTAYTSGGTATEPFKLTVPYALADLATIAFVQSADTMYLAHPTYAPSKLTRTAHNAWAVTAIQVDPTNAAPTGVSAVKTGSGSDTFEYMVSSVSAEGVESFPSTASASITNDLTISGNKNTVSWSAAAGAVEYRVFKSVNGAVYGYIGYTESLSLVDKNISQDTEDTPVKASGFFGGAGDFPATVTLHRERLGFAASDNEPEFMWFSRTANYENFTKSRVTKATDAIEDSVTGQQVNRVRHMVSLPELVVLTAGGEWAVSGASGIFAPGELSKAAWGYVGASTVRPLVVEQTLLYVEPSGRVVRDLQYYADAGYEGEERNIFAPHYFENREVVSWCYARSPHSVIWAAMSDGALLSFTYHRRHQVWAWCDHDVGGEVEWIESIREGNEDTVYMIVKRTINSQTKRYVERLHRRYFATAADAFFVDSGLTYDGAPATVLSGFDHLEGETVCALADGDVVVGLTVTAGSVTLPRAYSKVHVGYNFTSDLETLPTAVNNQQGAKRGSIQKVVEVKVQLEQTRGIKIGPSATELSRVKRTEVAPLSSSIPLFTGMIEHNMKGGWNVEGTVYIRQENPLPMTVVGIVPSLEIAN